MASSRQVPGEYGADAFNANIQAEDQEAQAAATEALTGEIIGKASVLGRGPCIGGFIFEFSCWAMTYEPSVCSLGARNRRHHGQG